jgi:hypothetical protein
MASGFHGVVGMITHGFSSLPFWLVREWLGFALVLVGQHGRLAREASAHAAP